MIVDAAFFSSDFVIKKTVEKCDEAYRIFRKLIGEEEKDEIQLIKENPYLEISYDYSRFLFG